MAERDIEIVKNPGGVLTFQAEDRNTSGLSATMKYGEPVKVAGTGSNFVQLLATGDPEISTDEFVGIVNKESTETASADGEVEVQTLIPFLSVLRGKATTSGNIDTASELLGVINDWVTFDYASSTFTIDEDEGSDPNVHGLCIITGDINDGTLDVIVHANATHAAPLTGQTMD
jgi:hypothetical protein